MPSKKLIDELDRVFSIFVRKRDCISGWCSCICCGKPIVFENADAAHYIPREAKSARWDERNVHACCVSCNRYMDGNIPSYKIGLINLYGPDIIIELERLKWTAVKFSDSDLREKIKYYKSIIKNLDKWKVG